VSLLALALVLGAAVLHATWNVLLKTSENPLHAAARAVTSSAVLLTIPVAILWLVGGRPGLPPVGWLLALVSGVLELGYFIFLSVAYTRGELSMVYPLARGTAPLLAVAIGLTVLGERVSVVALAGVGCLLAGVWAVRRPASAGAATVPALLTAVCIAAYSAVDRVGVRLGPVWLYAWALWVWVAILLGAWVLLRERNVTWRRADWRRGLAIGAPMTAAYLMVLGAFRLAPLTLVAPVRESAIVLVTGWGVWRLRERTGAWLRMAGAVAILAGVALIAFK
jgi:drug/metabolite transporter (DMT)-like permease